MNLKVKKFKRINEFIIDRLKNYLKDKQIRFDIIESSISFYGIDDLLKFIKNLFS